MVKSTPSGGQNECRILERVGMILPLARDLDLKTEFWSDNPTDEELADRVAIFSLGLFDGAVVG